MLFHALNPFGVEKLGPHHSPNLVRQVAHLHLALFAGVPVIVLDGLSRDDFRCIDEAAVGAEIGAATEEIVLIGHGFVEGEVHRFEAVSQGFVGRFAERPLAVGVAVPTEEDIRQILFILPGRGIDGKLGSRLIDAGHAGKNAVGGLPESVIFGENVIRFRRLLEQVFAHVILFQRFIQPGNGLHAFVQKFDGSRKIVASNPGNPDGDIDAWSAELFQGDHFKSIHPAVGPPDRLHPEKVHHLGHAFPFRPHDIGTLPVEGDVFGIFPFFLKILLDGLAGQLATHFPGDLRGHPVRIQRVEIPTRGQDIGPSPRHDARWARRDIAAVHAVQERPELIGEQRLLAHLINFGLDCMSQLGNVTSVVIPANVGIQRPETFEERLPLLQVTGAGLFRLPVHHILQDGVIQPGVFRISRQQVLHHAAQGIRRVVVADNGVNELGKPIPFRDSAEDVHAFGDVGILEQREGLVGRLHHLVETGSRNGLHHAIQIPFAQFRLDHVFHGMGFTGLEIFQLFVLEEQPFDLVQIAVELPLDHDRLHMVHEGPIAAPLGDGAFGGIVGIVKVEVGHFIDPGIGEAAGGETGGLARQEFEIAVGAHMNDGVSPEFP